MASPELTALSIANSPQQNRSSVTPEGQAAAERIAEARRLRDSGLSAQQSRRMLEPTISANQIAEGATPVTVPQPAMEPVPANPFGSAEQTLGNIRAQSEAAQRLKENEMELSAFMDGESAFDLGGRMLQEFGVTPDILKQRKEIGDQLASLIASSDFKKEQIASDGQGAIQGVRSLTQQDRETAVFAKQLEAQAANLDGQINLGRQLAGDAVDLMLADRDLKYSNLIRQNQALASQVDEETRQLLLAENRRYEESLAEDQRYKASVDQAIASGVATNEEIAQLTSPLPTHSDPATQEQLQTQAIQERQALAQSVQARGAAEKRAMEIEGKRASNAAAWALANQRNDVTPGSTYNTPFGEQVAIPTFEEWADENGGRVWQLGGTEEQTRNLRQEYDDEISVMQQAAKVARLSPLAREVVNNPQAYYDFTSTQKGEIFEELSKAGLDTNSIIAGKKRPLPATQVTEITQAQGVKEDVQKLYEKLRALPGTGPIGGRLQALDPWNAKRVEIEALITSIVPGLARGIFNEVGVLTDTDVTRYRDTLANPNMTDEQIDLLHNQTMAKIDQSLSMGLNNYSLAGYAVDRFIEESLPDPAETGGTDADPLGLGI